MADVLAFTAGIQLMGLIINTFSFNKDASLREFILIAPRAAGSFLDKQTWRRKPEEVTNEEDVLLFVLFFNDWEGHLVVKHLDPRCGSVGLLELADGRNNLELHGHRVFIGYDCDELMPECLFTTEDVADTENQPLNFSSNNLQLEKISRVIINNLGKKYLEVFANIAVNDDDYFKSDGRFGKGLNSGVPEALINCTEATES